MNFPTFVVVRGVVVPVSSWEDLDHVVDRYGKPTARRERVIYSDSHTGAAIAVLNETGHPLLLAPWSNWSNCLPQSIPA